MSRTRVGLALSGAALLLACGGVAAAATGAPSADPALGDSVAMASPTPTTSPTADDGDEARDDDGADQGDDDADQGDDDAGDDAPGTGAVGPDAAGPAHHGLCTAWSHVQHSPGRAAQSTAFRNVQQIDCSDVLTKEKGTEDADEGTDAGKGSKSSKSSKDKAAKNKAAKGKTSKSTSGSHGKR